MMGNKTFDWDAYGRGVIANEIPVCAYVRSVVQRHYDDLSVGLNRGLHFSEQHAQHALESFLFLRHSKGKWAGSQFVPSLWQQWWIAQAFGWMRADGTRRFRKIWLEVPRKNGKTTLLAGIGLYLLYFDNEPGAEIYAAATKVDQAKILFSEAERMVQFSQLSRHISMRRNQLFVKGQANCFMPLGRDSDTLDGLNPQGGLLDEVHAHPDRSIYDVIESGMGAREQPMLWQITTAGFNLSSFGYEQHQYAASVAAGNVQDDEFLPIIYTVDDPKKWTDPNEWAKANPGMGESVYLEGLSAACESAIKRPTEQRNFKTKRLNIWLAGGESWISVSDWQACSDTNLRIENFAGWDCWAALDLAEKSDVAALTFIFKRGRQLVVFVRFYLNEYEVSKPENDHLRRYAQRGELIVTPGNATDFDVIRDDIKRFSGLLKIVEISFDPKFAAYFARQLAEDGHVMVEISQTSSNFTMPVTEVENNVLTRDLVHEGNSMMEWMISNVVLYVSKFGGGLKHPGKAKKENKIDGPVSMLMAAGRALMHEAEPDMDEFINDPIYG